MLKLLFAALVLTSACAAPTPTSTADGGEDVEGVDGQTDAGERADASGVGFRCEADRRFCDGHLVRACTHNGDDSIAFADCAVADAGFVCVEDAGTLGAVCVHQP